jgi:hypothetical protein
METSSHMIAELDRILDGVHSSARTDDSDDGQSVASVSVTRAVIVTGERESFDPALSRPDPHRPW